ncbi:MAG: sulfatase-like hydrolase/transferase, partial [Chromatiales bacterium]|nr:sulfatase-like hydrolase/transferase [Chromatiales bacterium]
MNKPNFLFIITDQQRHDHLGCAGNPLLLTPNIDSLAKGGVRFENFYVASPICMPNRSSIMTGRMPSSHGVRFNGIPLSLDSVTFVDVLRAAGYSTALLGKSHLQNFTDLPVTSDQEAAAQARPAGMEEAMRCSVDGPAYEMEREPNAGRVGRGGLQTPFYGFDHVKLCTRHGDQVRGDYTDWLEERHPGSDGLRGRENATSDDRYSAPQARRTGIPQELYSSAYVAEQTEAFLEQHATNGGDAPFFIQCSFPDPHPPYTPPGEFWDMYDPAAVVLPASFEQKHLPPTVAHVHEQTRLGNTAANPRMPFAVSKRHAQEITALTYGMVSNVDRAVGQVLAKLEALGLADNTVVIFTSDHGDFMGDRGIMLKGPLHYQGVAKVPFIWHEPALHNPGRVAAALGSSLDISSTVLARAGLPQPNGMQGEDLAPVIVGDATSVRSDILIEQDTQSANFGFSSPIRARTYINERWRLSSYLGSEFAELYDLRLDPH